MLYTLTLCLVFETAVLLSICDLNGTLSKRIVFINKDLCYSNLVIYLLTGIKQQFSKMAQQTPSPPLKLNLDGNYPHYPNYLQFLKRPHPHSVFILCAWYTIWVSILIKSIVLSLFLAFITLSDNYNPHHPPSEGCTFRSQKRAFYTFTKFGLDRLC